MATSPWRSFGKKNQTQRLAMKFCQVLHQIGALRQRYNGVPEGHEELNSDEWLKGFLMLSILEEVFHTQGFSDSVANGGSGFSAPQVAPDRMKRLLAEISLDPIMEGIKIQTETRVRHWHGEDGRVDQNVTWQAYVVG